MSIHVRSLLPKDHELVVELIKRLSEFDMPKWRQADQVERTNISLVKTAMDEMEPGTAIFVAEDETKGKAIGFVRLQTQTDYFSGEKLGYVSNLAVDKSYEGLGVGRMLLEKSEDWAKENGYSQLTLHVFIENDRAQKVYEKDGFHQDIIKYVKVLGLD